MTPPPDTQPEIVEVPLVMAAVVRDVVEMGSIADFFDQSFGQILATLVAEGLAGVWWPSSEPMPGRASDYQASADQARASAVGSWSTCDQLGRS